MSTESTQDRMGDVVCGSPPTPATFSVERNSGGGVPGSQGSAFGLRLHMGGVTAPCASGRSKLGSRSSLRVP